ncbi:peripheral-type benzodiazepine receptor-associated protein 1 isoform X2 [Pogona vitticeps]
MKNQEEAQPSGEVACGSGHVLIGTPESDGQGLGAMPETESPPGDPGAPPAPEDEVLSQGSSPCSSEATPESTGPCAAEGASWGQADPSPQYGVTYRCLLRQNQVLLTALEELQSRCASLKKENNLLRKTCFPETQEKVRHLKRKNAELAIIAKRLEERARKLQEANLKVVNASVVMKGSCAGLCKKALARQRATDLRDQATALLAKDKQIKALQQECQELQAKITSGKEISPPLLDFHHLLRESQKEVLRLQRQIALKNFKASTGSPCGRGSRDASGAPSVGLGPPMASRATTCPNGFSPPRGSRVREELSPATEAASKTALGVLHLTQRRVGDKSSFSVKKGVTATTPEIKHQIQQLESELRRKRKQCENLEYEVRKKHRRYAELEIQLQEVRSDNARLSEENASLHGQVEWIEKVESQNADLRLQVAVVTEERDSALQKTQELQTRLESIGQALKHMRDVAERRQHLELEHEKALQALQKKQEEVRQLQQAQAEARKEHEGAVQLLEESLDCMQARVRELESQCQSHTEQFNFLTQELKRYRLQTVKIGSPPSPPLAMPEVAFATCCASPPQLLEDIKEKGPERVSVSPSHCLKVQDEEGEGVSPAAPRHPSLVVPSVARSPDIHLLPVASKKAIKKLESQSSSSRSESIPTTSPKSCPTPEVDTASEMEELDIDSVSLIPEPENPSPVKLRVFLARYSYNPFDGPNENPEAELPLTAGEYIYVYGEMDEDGFFEGELMDGRRGLVPSNFVERVSDDDLVAFFPGELNDLSQSSPVERSFLSTSISSGEKSDYSIEEISASAGPSRLEGDLGGVSAAVPYPRKVSLIKQFRSSLLVGWEPPLLPAGSSEIQSYNVYVDAEIHQNVKAGSQTKAVLEKLDLKTRAYRVSVQSVSEKGASDCLRCTFLVGRDFALAPSQLKVRSIGATSAEIVWVPSNSNFPHAIYLNGQPRDVAKAGVYWYAFHNLNPSTPYVARVEVRPQPGGWESPQEQPLAAEIHFTTASAGSPDPPLDVRVEPGPTPGILVISWLPVTIDAEGSSNGVRVTGYAVYADGRKVIELTSPTAGSVLVEVSQLQILQACREVSVRTISLYGESADSVPAQIPSVLLEGAGGSSPGLTSRLPSADRRTFSALPTSRASGSDLDSAAHLLVNKFNSEAKVGHEKGPNSLLAERSPNNPASQASDPSTDPKADPPPREEADSHVTSTEDPATLPEVLHKGPGENSQEQLLAVRERERENPGSHVSNLEMCPNCPAEQDLRMGSPERRAGNEASLQGAEMSSPDRLFVAGEDGADDGGQNERGAPEAANGSSGRAKLLKEIPRDDANGLVTRVKREGEKRLDPGNRPLNLLADHSRGSDLSDIIEEEEEDEEEEETRPSGQWAALKGDPSKCPSGENGEKQQEPGDTDSDDEILERILEMPLPNNCRKALFSIPEVAEEEEEEEEAEAWGKPPPSHPASPPPEKKAGDFDLEEPRGPTRRMALSPPASPLRENIYQNLPDKMWPARGHPPPSRREDMRRPSPASRGWERDCMEQQTKPAGEWRGPRRSKEKVQWTRKQRSDANPERRAYQTRGGLYRAQSLKENLDIISSLGVQQISDLCLGARPRPHQASPRRTTVQEPGGEPFRGVSRSLSPESMEISIEYDSDDDLTVTSTAASQPSSDGRADGSPTDCEEGWSDCSGSVPSSGPRELKRCSSWEEESAEWSGSPVGSPGLRRRIASEERSRSLERSPALWRAVHERPGREGARAPSLHTWAATDDGFLESLSSATWRAPTRRGRRLRRKRREAAATGDRSSAGAWRSPSPETMDEEDSSRLFVALFDFDPVSMSPNPDAAEEELPFQEGQVLKVYGHKDADGFYRGECGGRIGYIPCNMVSEIQVDSERARQQLLQEGRLSADRLEEHPENSAFSPPAQRPRTRPPKPRRSKKVGQKRKDTVSNFGECSFHEVKTGVSSIPYNHAV